MMIASTRTNNPALTEAAFVAAKSVTDHTLLLDRLILALKQPSPHAALLHLAKRRIVPGLFRPSAALKIKHMELIRALIRHAQEDKPFPLQRLVTLTQTNQPIPVRLAALTTIRKIAKQWPALIKSDLLRTLLSQAKREREQEMRRAYLRQFSFLFQLNPAALLQQHSIAIADLQQEHPDPATQALAQRLQNIIREHAPTLAITGSLRPRAPRYPHGRPQDPTTE